MKYRSCSDRCPVGGLTMMTSFLAALTMTSSFGPKSRTSTGWSNMALVSASFLLYSISRMCLAWRTSTARSKHSKALIFGCDDPNNNTTRISQVFTARNPLTPKNYAILRELPGSQFSFFHSKHFLVMIQRMMAAPCSHCFCLSCKKVCRPCSAGGIFSGLLWGKERGSSRLALSKNVLSVHPVQFGFHFKGKTFL